MSLIINETLNQFREQHPDWFGMQDHTGINAMVVLQIVRFKDHYVLLAQDNAHYELIVGVVHDDDDKSELIYKRIDLSESQKLGMLDKFYKALANSVHHQII